jgi:large subunit ribosomal protein L30
MIMYAVIRLRGSVNVRQDFKDALKMLRLNRKMHCILVDEKNLVMKGMIHKVKDRITWGEIDDETLKMLVEKRGRKAQNVRLTQKEADDVFRNLKEGKPTGIKPVFRLTPPSKGFKYSIKDQYPKGELGYRAEKINELLKRMI